MMFNWPLSLNGLLLLCAMASLTWLISLLKRDVSIVDSVWSLFFAAALLLWWYSGGDNGVRAPIAALLIGLWSSRLCLYLTWRNWGQPEDRRYQLIRERNQPHYGLKSLIIVFILQALLAWIIALPILPVLKSTSPWSWLDTIGVTCFLIGLSFETIADSQMARFRADPLQHGKVMSAGLWRYSRHPNYFGECVLWWGFYGLAMGAGAPAWILVSPLLMTFLLMKVSGVPMLEQDLIPRRPAYQDYIRRTSAFLPMPPRSTNDR